MKRIALIAILIISSLPLLADVSLTDKKSTMRILAQSAQPLTPAEKQALRDANKAKKDAKKSKHAHGLTPASDVEMLSAPRLSPVQKQALRDANKAKHDAKRAKHGHSLRASSDSLHPRSNAIKPTIQLVDAGGLKYFINTDVTFS